MTIALSTRSRCDECDRPAVLVDRGAFLCELCDVRINGEVENSNSDAAASRPADIATAGHSSPRLSAVAPLSIPAPNALPIRRAAPVNCGDASASSLFSSADGGMCGFGFDFDAAISALEAGWRRGG